MALPIYLCLCNVILQQGKERNMWPQHKKATKSEIIKIYD